MNLATAYLVREEIIPGERIRLHTNTGSRMQIGARRQGIAETSLQTPAGFRFTAKCVSWYRSQVWEVLPFNRI